MPYATQVQFLQSEKFSERQYMQNTITNPRVNDGILEISPYVGGNSNINGPILAMLASNENPHGCSLRVAEVLQELRPRYSRYPDGGSTALRSAIAKYVGADAEQ